MRTVLSKAAPVGLCLAVVLAVSARAAEEKKQLEIGKPAPALKLPGVDGKQVDTDELLQAKKKKALVVVWMANHCPVAVAYQDRLIQLQKDYEDKGVQIIAVSSTDASQYDSDSFENMKKRAKEKGYNFPFVYDESQDVARAFRATCTPHVFVINQEGNLVYRGAVDDSQNPKKATKHYTRDALDATLGGKPVETAETPQFGCSIKWKKK